MLNWQIPNKEIYLNSDDLFDFPCSYVFRRYAAWVNQGILLPPIDDIQHPVGEPTQKERFEKPIHLSHKQWHEINQLKAEVMHLQNKLNEHLDRSKKIASKPRKGILLQ